MSEQETLRLVMEAVDKYSPEMKKFMNTLKGISAAGKDANQQGTKQTTEHGKAYKLLAEQMAGLKTKGIDVARPALAEMGIAVTSVAGAVAAMGVAVVKSTSDWAGWGQTMTFAHRSSGLQIGTLRGLAEANVEYGESQEDTIKNLEEFGQLLDQQARRSPTLMNAWKQFPTVWNELGKSLDGLTKEQALAAAMKFVPTINDSDQRARVLAFLHLPPNWRDLTSKEMADLEQAAADFDSRFPFDAAKAYEAKHAWEELRSTFRGLYSDLGNTVGSALFDDMKYVEDHADKFQFIRDAVSAVKDVSLAALKQDAKDIASMFEGLVKVIELIKNGPGDKNSWWNRPMFKGNNSLFGGDKKFQDNVKKGVKEGVKEGLTDFSHALKEANDSYVPMAFHPDGSVRGGGGGKFGSEEFPALSDEQTRQMEGGGGAGQRPKSMGRAPDGTNVPVDGDGMPTGGGAGINRDMRFQQLNNNPRMKEELYRRSLGENSNPLANQAVMEEAANRDALRSKLHGDQGFAGHGNLSYFKGYFRGDLSKYRKMLDSNFDKVFRQGSDIAHGAVDNSSQGLAYTNEHGGAMGGYGWPGKKPGRFKTTANFGGDGVTGHKGVESFEIPGWGESGSGEGAAWPALRRAQLNEAATRLAATHGSRLRDMARRGRSPSDAELLRRGMKGVDAGDALNSNAHLTVDLNGFPRGTKTATKTDGFKTVTLNRGRPMAPASETS
jgi:hypothetical protein